MNTKEQLKPSFYLDKASGAVRAAVRKHGNLIWIEPYHSVSRKEALKKAAAKILELGRFVPENFAITC